MADLIVRFNTVALIERFNHVARGRPCSYEGIEINTKFRLILISNVEKDSRGARVVLSLMMRESSLGQLFLPPLFNNVFSSSDMYNINEERARLSITIVKLGDSSKHLRLDILDDGDRYIYINITYFSNFQNLLNVLTLSEDNKRSMLNT